ncbi:MAG: bifunctional serine/threonine-protein kinase/formylglycine-generating enzyme family protein, partial [Gammaproteobacteria bacterium]
MDEQHRNALKPGSRLEWYEILHVIGQGGFGITYLARDTHLNIRVAIKEYLPSELAARDANATVSPLSTTHGDRFLWGRARFLDEARMLAGFDHPNIVRVNAFFEANNTACMVMRYEAGQSLHKILEHYGRLNEDTLQGLLHPLLDGLEVIHAQQIIHRDIKPENIFMRTDNRPVLLDFGSARQALGAANATLTMLVSPGYAAIEQYSRDSDTQGPWTDIYGLAATLYRAISGKSPADAMQRSIALHHDEPDPLTPLAQLVDGEYSAEFLAAVDQALAFKPAQRPQNVNDWRTAFGTRPTQAAPPILLPDEEAVTQQPDAMADEMPGTGDKAAGTFANSTLPDTHTRRLPVWQRLNARQQRLGVASLIVLAIMAAGAVWYFVPTASETRRLPMLADPLLSGERGPIMVVVPAGRYLMGAPESEPDREADEGPQIMVEIPRALAVSRTEVTVGQFRQFVNHANYVTEVEQNGGCHHRTDVWIQYSSLSWR